MQVFLAFFCRILKKDLIFLSLLHGFSLSSFMISHEIPCFFKLNETFKSRGHSIVKIRGAGSIVWGLGFWLGKDILGFFKNIDLDNGQGVVKMIHMDN